LPAIRGTRRDCHASPGCCPRAIDLDQHRVVDVLTERILNVCEIRPVAVRRQLRIRIQRATAAPPRRASRPVHDPSVDAAGVSSGRGGEHSTASRRRGPGSPAGSGRRHFQQGAAATAEFPARTSISAPSAGAPLASSHRGHRKQVRKDVAMTGTMHSLQQLMCGLRGHDEVLCFERRRLALKCLSCGHESAGSTLLGENRHPERTAPSPPRRLAHGHSLASSVH
jgi:hypothetical protein